MESICLGIITLERTEAWPIASAPRPPRTRGGKSNKKMEEKEKGEKNMQEITHGNQPKFSCYEQKKQ